MKKADVELNRLYLVKVSGKLVRVHLTGPCIYGGWMGTNLSTKREIRIRSAARLRGKLI